jgi:chemotaxis protein methyltransferase CheR
MVSFKHLNLLSEEWPISTQVDAIFCRNVMIYFDKLTQSNILHRFVTLLKPDGLLFSGHSENLAFVTDRFTLRGKTVYELSQRFGA